MSVLLLVIGLVINSWSVVDTGRKTGNRRRFLFISASANTFYSCSILYDFKGGCGVWFLHRGWSIHPNHGRRGGDGASDRHNILGRTPTGQSRYRGGGDARGAGRSQASC